MSSWSDRTVEDLARTCNELELRVKELEGQRLDDEGNWTSLELERDNLQARVKELEAVREAAEEYWTITASAVRAEWTASRDKLRTALEEAGEMP